MIIRNTLNTVYEMLHALGASKLLHMLESRPTVKILVYHRIAEGESNFDRDTVSATPKNFRKQMVYLKKNYDIISFADYMLYLKNNKKLPKNSLIISFDDGYKDNFLHAYPYLKNNKIPATVFLATGYINSKKLFWWDKVAFMIHNTKEKSVVFNGVKYSTNSNNKTEDTIKKILGQLKSVDEKTKESLISNLQKKLKVVPKNKKDMFLSWDNIREMSKNNIEFGSHTESHNILTRIPLEKAESEIKKSKSKIEKEISKSVVSFCYPNGEVNDFNKKIKSILRKNKFLCAVTNKYGGNNGNKNLLELNRISINFRDSMGVFKFKVEAANSFMSSIYNSFELKKWIQ